MRRSPRRMIPVLLVLAVIGGAYWVQQSSAAGQASGFSGTLEATNIYLASQVGGPTAGGGGKWFVPPGKATQLIRPGFY